MTLHDFIKQRKHLVWYVRDYDKLDKRAVLEATLNYGTWDDVQMLLKIIGVPTAAALFRKHSRGQRTNYPPKVQHYFTLYFKRYA